MTNNPNYTLHSNTNEAGIQLIMPLNYEVLIPKDDSVRLLSDIVEEMDLSRLSNAYSLNGRNSVVPPRIMLKVLIYAYMEGIYSSRKIEKACQRDINFKWLLNGYPVPDHNTICRFRRERLAGSVEDIMRQFTLFLKDMGEVSFENIFIDGTKIEANANKYTFVWKKSAEKYHRSLLSKIPDFLNRANTFFGTEFAVNGEGTEKDVMIKARTHILDAISTNNITFVYGTGKRKHELQRMYEEVDMMISKKEMYDDYFETFNGRNNFCKTDKDATFLHMKDDHMRNAQLKPGYNIQIGVEGGYVIGVSAFPDANDLHTLIPFLEKINRMYDVRIRNVVCDAGYESEENYAYLEKNKQDAYIKPAFYDRWKKRSFKKDISKIENMIYDAEGDFYVCSQGYILKCVGKNVVRKKKSGYETLVSRYACENCEGCPVKEKCTKAKGNRTLKVSHEFMRLREASLKRITSNVGIKLRINRSIQAEGAFGGMKEDMNFRRFLTRGTENIMTEYQLLCIGFNINKLHNRIQTGECGKPLYELKEEVA